MFRKIIIIVTAGLILALVFTFFYLFRQKENPQEALSNPSNYHPEYLIVLVGDSMTDYLGNSTELRQFLNEYYPGISLDVYNYGFGSTNILSLPERLTSWTKYGRDFQPILDTPFDLIIIESFGHNPLSDFPLAEGLKKQEETLDKAVELIKNRRPNSKIIFLATLAPNKQVYGGHLVDLSSEDRAIWANERSDYIKNHIKYANTHNIPLINVFEKSLNSDGNGSLEYIESQTYIHPSPKGIIFISQEIADFIYQNKLIE